MEGKTVAIIFGFFILCCGVALYITAANDTRKFYLPLQEQANHLLSLQCNKKPCVVEGSIEYIETRDTHTVKGVIFLTPIIYEYKYRFEIAGNSYSKKLLVFGERSWMSKGTSYLPNAKIILGKQFPERILYDPHDPTVSLPESYAKVLSKIPNPYNADKKNGIIYIIFSVMIFIVALVQRKKSRIEA